jgi:hypothetical protein
LKLQPAPVEGGELAQKLSDLEMIVSHFLGLRDKFLADVFGDRFALDLGSKVITALGRGLVDRANEEVQVTDDLIFKPLAAELNEFELLHKRACYDARI